MLEILKRYSMALIFLFVVVALMLVGTLGVMSFGNKIVHDIGSEMKPRGEDLTK
jgi:hypothetical protein